MRVADRGRNAAVRDGNDKVRLHWIFDREFRADRLARLVNGTTIEDRIRSAEIYVFKDAWARLALPERSQRSHLAVMGDLHDFTRLDLPDEFRPDDVEGDGFACEGNGIADLPHYQGADAERIAAGDHSFGRHYEQRIGAFDHPQGVDEPVDHRGIARSRYEMDDNLGVRGRLENRPALDEILAQGPRVGDIAVVSDSEPAARQVSEQRLDVPES